MAYILIIDDDDDFAAATAEVLRASGHDVEIALEPESGLHRMEQRRPQLVILDVMFPEQASGGFGLARQMRHFKEGLSDIPILMLSAVNAEFPMQFSSGDIDPHWLPVTDFIDKPVDLDILVSKVSGLLDAASGRASTPGTR